MSRYRKEVNLILGALKKGDTAKQQVLYDNTVNKLKVVALYYAADKNDYEDILIEAYLRVFKYINSFDPDKDGYNWMCKVVQNVAFDFNKTPTSLPLEELTFTNILGDDLDKIIAKDDLLNLLCKLSPKEQNLIYLRFYEGLTYSEIAKRLNSKKSTVHKQVGIILKKFRE